MNTRNKWKSRRFLLTVWAAVLDSWLVLNAEKIDASWVQVALALTAIVAVFIGGETWAKKYLDPDSSLNKRKEE